MPPDASPANGRSARSAPPARAIAGHPEVLVAATLLGIWLNFTGLSAIRALFLATIANDLISPTLLILPILSSRDRAVLSAVTTSRLISLLGWFTTLAMAAAATRLLGTIRWS